jgi:Fe-S-cluster containining protein
VKLDVPREPLPAGGFSAWLANMREALSGRGGVDVACGDCRGCCTSSYYVKVRAHETRALARIGAVNLQDGPPQDRESRLMGFHANGHCRMLVNGNCSIYEDRPETCRSYDCRIYAAAGTNAGPDKPLINERIVRWKFDYPEERDRKEHDAVKAAASFLRQHPVRFPGGHVPSRPGEIAVLAVKTYTVFLERPPGDAQTSAALVQAALEFSERPDAH